MRTRPNRSVLFASALVATAGLAGCAYQDPLSLPPLGPAGSASSPAPYYGHGGGYYDPRYGAVYPYGRAPQGGYYDPRTGHYYVGGYPGYYGPLPYPPPGYRPYPGVPVCVDANRDGRCDHRPGNGGGGGGGSGSGGGSHGGGSHGGGGHPGGDGDGPSIDPKRNPFEQVRDLTRRSERSPHAAPAPTTPPASASPPAPPRPPRAVDSRRSDEPKPRSTEARRATTPKRGPATVPPETD